MAMRRVLSTFSALILLTALCAGRSRADEPATVSPPSHSRIRAGASAHSNPKQLKPKRLARNVQKKAANGTPGATASPAGRLPQMVIVVTPNRVPEPLAQVGTTTSVVPAATIQTQQLRSAIDALREVPGVQIVQSGSPGSLAEVFIRGAPPDQNLIMLDGVPVNDSATSSFDLSRITTGDLQQIEVVRGAGGALYGSQAIGGVINLTTREGSGAPKFSLLSEGGNRASTNQVATFDGADGKLAYSGALTYFSTTGFRPVNDNSDNLTGTLRLDYHLDENTTLRGFARYIRANVSLPEFSISSGIPLNPTTHQRNEFMLFKGEIDRQLTDRLLARLSAFYVRDEVRVNETPFTGNPFSETDHIPDETRGGNLDAVYTWTPALQSLVGFDFLDRWVHSGDDFVGFAPPPLFRSVTVFNARRQEYAGYVQQQAQFFNGHILATGGFRVDGNSTFGEEVSPAWSVAIPFPQYGLTLRGNYAEGFRAPTFNELYFPGFGNRNLAPELSSEYDGGITQKLGETASVTVTYFSRRVHGQIVAVPCTFNQVSCPFGTIAGNAGRVDTQGVEFVPSWHPYRELDLSGSLTYLDQRHDPPLFSRQPVRVPKYSAAAIAQYQRSNLLRAGDRAIATTAYSFVGDRDDITPEGGIANHAAYHRVDLALSYAPGISWRRIRNEELLVRIQNLLDRRYSEAFGFPAPPVNFLAGMKLDF
jgi:vitamin B12 transporter